MTNPISPCPFCGHTGYDIRDFLHPTAQGWRDDPFGEEGKPFRHYMRYNDPRVCHGQVWEMGCLEHEGGCGATMTGDSREEVIAKWNRRPERKLVGYLDANGKSYMTVAQRDRWLGMGHLGGEFACAVASAERHTVPVYLP